MFFIVFFCGFAVRAGSVYEELEGLKEQVQEGLRVLEEVHGKVVQLNREARVLNIKAIKTVAQLKKSTDVAIYELFNSEIQRKHSLGESIIKGAEKSLEAGSVPKRILKVIDFYIKRQQVPDPEMHIYLVQLERKIGDLSKHIKKVYNLNNINISLILILIALATIITNLKTPEKKHKQ